VIPATLFGFMLSYQGVRMARSTFLVDFAPEADRATYTALANTVIGVLLLVTGAIGGLLALAGASVALTGFAVIGALGGGLALRLPEVEKR
jgi:small-conductance mechanosensitive channel